jgi:hypothetical protein
MAKNAMRVLKRTLLLPIHWTQSTEKMHLQEREEKILAPAKTTSRTVG